MKFNVGDTIEIKEWDDMALEFGLDSGGDIPCEATFRKNMRSLCGDIYEIESINSNSRVKFTNPVDWHISFDMIKQLDAAKPVPKLPVLVVPITTYEISNAVNQGYTIREFYDNKCILELTKTLGVRNEDKTIGQ